MTAPRARSKGVDQGAVWVLIGGTSEKPLWSTSYSAGEEVGADSREDLRHYSGSIGEYAEMIAEGAVRTGASIRDTVAQFEDVGVTEVYFDPIVASLDQIDRLATSFSENRARQDLRRLPAGLRRNLMAGSR